MAETKTWMTISTSAKPMDLAMVMMPSGMTMRAAPLKDRMDHSSGTQMTLGLPISSGVENTVGTSSMKG